MSNMQKTNDFLAELKKAGLSKSFEKICLVASKTIGCDLEDLIDDMVHQMETPAPELTPVWRVKFQDRWMEKRKEFWWLPNPKAETMGTMNDFPTQQAAMIALNNHIRECNKGARTVTTCSNGIGFDLVIDEKSANDKEIIHWKLVRKYVSKWEVIEEA